MLKFGGHIPNFSPGSKQAEFLGEEWAGWKRDTAETGNRRDQFTLTGVFPSPYKTQWKPLLLPSDGRYGDAARSYLAAGMMYSFRISPEGSCPQPNV